MSTISLSSPLACLLFVDCVLHHVWAALVLVIWKHMLWDRYCFCTLLFPHWGKFLSMLSCPGVDLPMVCLLLLPVLLLFPRICTSMIGRDRLLKTSKDKEWSQQFLSMGNGVGKGPRVDVTLHGQEDGSEEEYVVFLRGRVFLARNRMVIFVFPKKKTFLLW